MNLELFNQAHKGFCEVAFPEITDYRSPLRHMKEEIDEAIDSGEPEEFADILMLLLSSFRLRFPELDTHDLLHFAIEKLNINQCRSWGMNEEGYATHIEEDVEEEELYVCVECDRFITEEENKMFLSMCEECHEQDA